MEGNMNFFFKCKEGKRKIRNITSKKRLKLTLYISSGVFFFHSSCKTRGIT